MRNRAGAARVAVLALAASGLVAGAAWSSGTAQLAAPHARAGLPQSSDVLVEEATLLCPGQSQQGGEGLRNVPGTVRVAAAAPSSDLLPGTDLGGHGALGLTAIPTGTSLVSAADPRRAVTALVPVATAADSVSATATGALAPGLLAAQTWLRAGDDDRGLSLTPCTRPAPDVWLLGGAAGPSRTERLVLTNPGANAVSVRLEVLGAKGPAAGVEDRSVSIAPGGRAVVSVDALAPSEPSPVVHVIASGGVVGAVLVDSWIDGATGRGTDTVTGSVAPRTDLIVPGVDAGGPAILRLVNPGTREALAQVRLLTPTGAAQPESLRAVRVPARSSLDVPLETPAKGTGAVRVVSDQPLTAGAWMERRAASGDDRMGDFGWAPATPAIKRLGGLAIPREGPRHATDLALAAGGTQAKAAVSILASGSVTRSVVDLGVDTTTRVALGDADAVWIEPISGEIFGAVTMSGSDAQGPLYSVAAVYSSPVTALSVPVRQVGR
jgi:hypothetical protein